jgi:type IV pilus assembly protein PilM
MDDDDMMLDFLHKHRTWPIGLDVGGDGIRMLQLQSGNSRLFVQAGAQWLAGPEGLNVELDRQSATAAVSEILDAGAFDGQKVIASIPMDDVHVRTIRLPEMGPEELACMVQAQAHEVYDFDLSVSKLQALQSGHVISGDDSCREVILLAVPNDAIRRRQDALEALGLRVIHLDLEPMAMFRAFRRLRRRDSDRHLVSAVVEVARTGCVVIVAQGAHILFLKHLPFGEDDLTRATADQLGLTFEDTAQLRRQIMNDYAEHSRGGRMAQPDLAMKQCDDSIWWTVHDAVRAEVDRIVNEIGLCLRYCSTTFGCPKIEHVTLTGTGAWDPSLVLLLGQHFGLKCGAAAPLHDVDTSHCPFFGDRRTVLSDWTHCMGLACWAVAGPGGSVDETLFGGELCFSQQEDEA